MEDPFRVTVFDGIDNLKENSSNEFVVSEVPLTFRDHSEQVPFLTELQDNVDASLLLDNVVKGNDVRVSTRETVKGDLTTLERTLTRVESDLVQTLDGVEREVTELRMSARGRMRERSSRDIPREVDDSISS